jgi:molecular chaperone DnaK (HSP70)
MIRDSFEKAEEDLLERQVREARIEADNILVATEKAMRNEAWVGLTAEQQAAITGAIRDLQNVYHSVDHHEIQAKLEALNGATQILAENMMNTAVRGALRGTKID